MNERATEISAQLRDLLAKPTPTTQIPVRHHYLRAMGKCGAKCLACFMRDQAESTQSQKRGTHVHAMLFETARFAPMPKGEKRSGKKFDAVVELNPGCEILTASEYEKASRMADSIRACSEAMEVLTGEAEKTLYFDYLGRACRTTPDVAGAGFTTELKTAKDGEPERFGLSSKWYLYHAQMAFHLEARPDTEPFCVVVEAEPPYVPGVFRFTPRAIDVGQRFNRLQMERLLSCERSGQWPPYSQSILDLDVGDDDDIGLTFADEDEGEAA